jgi:hypothetical protein
VAKIFLQTICVQLNRYWTAILIDELCTETTTELSPDIDDKP